MDGRNNADTGTNGPVSNSVAYAEEAKTMVVALEDRERRRHEDAREARERLAGRIGCAPGTIESLRKGRLKKVDGWLRERIRHLLIREYEREIEALSHALETLRRGGAQPHSPAVGEVETHLATARKLIGALSAANSKTFSGVP